MITISKPSANYTKRQQIEDYKFSVVLWSNIVYPEPIEMMLNRLPYYWQQFFYAKHDQDVYTQEDVLDFNEDSENPDSYRYGKTCPFVAGDPKPVHWHIVAISSNPTLLGQATKRFGLPVAPTVREGDMSNMVQRVASVKGSVRYLAHQDNPEKFFYGKAAIKHNRDYPPDKYFSGAEWIDCLSTIKDLYNQNPDMTKSQFVDMCISLRYHAYVKQLVSIFYPMISDRNYARYKLGESSES